MQAAINQQNNLSCASSDNPSYVVGKQNYQIAQIFTNSGVQTQGSLVQGFNQQNNHGVLQKRPRSNKRGGHQTGQYGNPVIYQQFKPQIDQPQQVYQPSYILNQSANMTSDQSGGYNNQFITAQWLQSNVGAINQTYQTGQTFQENYLPASTAVPSHHPSNQAAVQSAQNLKSTPYFSQPIMHQNKASMASNPHSFPRYQHSASQSHPPNVGQWTQPSRDQFHSSLPNLLQAVTDFQSLTSQHHMPFISNNNNNFLIQSSFHSGSNQQSFD